MQQAPTRLHTALLSVVLLAALASASPSINVLWQMYFPFSPPSPILFGENVVLMSSQTSESGGYLNTVQALNYSQGDVVWDFSSFGEVQSLTTAEAFESIPKLAFLILNNLQPPNVTAAVPSTGAVAWSTAAAFQANSVAQLTASLDGRTVYLLTESPSSVLQLTAYDAATGEMLFAKDAVAEVVNVTRCGPSRVSCIAEWHPVLGSAFFWDGRTGALLKNISLPVNMSRWKTFSLPLLADLLLLSTSGNLYVVNTTSYTLAWKSQPWAMASHVVARAELFTAGKVSRTAVVAISIYGLVGLDAATGGTLWNTTAAAVCPVAAPAPGLATSFGSEQYSLGAFPADVAGSGVFSLSVTCYYSDANPRYLYVVGAMSATNGALKWWRYLSQYPSAYPLLPVGPKAFMVYSPSSGTEEFYSGLGAPSFGNFPQAGNDNAAVGVSVTSNGTVVVHWTYFQNQYLSGIAVSGN